MKTAATTEPRTGHTANSRAGAVVAAIDSGTRHFRCKRCGHSWTPRTAGTPKQCPACNSPNWNADAKTCLCSICGHTWTARGDRPPKQCPRCNNPNWRRAMFAVVMADRPLPTFREAWKTETATTEKNWRKNRRKRGRK